MLSHEKSQRLYDLKQQYENGTLDGMLLSSRMLEEIEKEVWKTESTIDNEWMEACLQLMLYANDVQETHALDRMQNNWQVIQNEIRGNSKSAVSNSFLHIACAVACILLMLFGVSFSWQWFSADQSEDQQEYTLQGQEVIITKENSAMADLPERFEECCTASYDEICTFLGYCPPIPTWLPSGWELLYYHAVIDGATIDFTATYEKKTVPHVLNYISTTSADVPRLSATYYQDGKGTSIHITDDIDVYVTSNMDDPIAIWCTDNSLLSVSGPISVQETLEIIKRIR